MIIQKYSKQCLIVSVLAMLFLVYEKYLDASAISFIAQLVIALIAYALVASDVVIKAFKTLYKQHRMTEEFLMMVATIGAFGLGDLPEALAVMIFYKIGALFEDYASGQAHSQISALVKLKPEKVRVIREDGSEEILKPRKVKIGDTIRVLKGEIIAIDGYLQDDSAAIDTSALTGESEPRSYTKGEIIPSGCINQGKVITLKVSTKSSDSSITRLLNLIEDAAANRSKPEGLIHRFSVWYTPIVVTMAVLLACVPFVYSEAQFSDWVQRALVFLVVSCPCALVLSVPLSFFGGMGAISRIGVMIKGSVHIETLAAVKTVAFDKTGTLTYGRFEVTDVIATPEFADVILSYAAALEKNSTHPIALSVVDYALKQDIKIAECSEVNEVSGMGLEAIIDGRKVRIGRYSFIKDFTEDDIPKFENDASSCVYLAVDDCYAGMIKLADTIKDGASSMISDLGRLGIRSVLISGDRKAVAEKVSADLNIDEVFSEQSPQGKLEILKRYKQNSSKIAFVGDGLNDAPVLVSADVGIAMGDIGSAFSVESADVVVMNGDIKVISKTISMCRRIYKLAISNMYLVMVIKLGILLLGALGIANIWLAIFGDVGVLILSVLNAMRSLRFN